ncbi:MULTISPECIES: LysR family transcriptional regulator ArgP [unclassified Mycobacterium]|uniref:LysR family transcriptional regulator ArgP n=1 Tax=unclassified Mycobacterium TaxID=2642494 RepID=UPI0029C678FD|nr:MULTISPECIES: LysR family transcriptional regulator ArgP [unclassified Mycobacterium]
MVSERLGADQLAAFAAVVEQGSFDAAAALLHVTPSAISQRIKALEQRVGQVLVIREKPCRATTAGIPLLRLAAQTALLESEALAETSGADARQSNRIAIAVNADSMSTWFTAVFAKLPDVLFDVRIEDQDHSARLLREGTVMGAVTTERTPVSGCRADPLGVMRYVPVASPAHAERFSEGFTADSVAAAPSLAWNRDDALQDMLVRKAFKRDVARPVHYVPTAEGFGAAVRAGLGWGMYPEQLADAGIARGDFTRISSQHLDVPLYWQCWKLDSPTARQVTDAVQTASARLLRHPPTQRNP